MNSTLYFRIILVVLGFLPLTKLRAQDQVLEDFDFLNVDYKFYFFHYLNGLYDDDDAEKIIEPFMIEDKSKLLDLKEKWIATNEVEGMLLCGYDYVIYIVLKDSIIGHLNVNTECGQVIAHGIGTSYDFVKGNPFENIVGDKKVFEAKLRADTITESRKLFKKIINSNHVYFPEANKQEWLNYDGRFYFYTYVKDTVSGLKSLKEVANDIYNKFRNDKILIDFWGFSRNRYDGYILCDSVFYKKINLDMPIWENFHFRMNKMSVWKPWHAIASKKKFSARVFSEDKNKLNELIKTAGNN
jgi:hypothetical protein